MRLKTVQKDRHMCSSFGNLKSVSKLSDKLTNFGVIRRFYTSRRIDDKTDIKMFLARSWWRRLGCRAFKEKIRNHTRLSYIKYLASDTSIVLTFIKIKGNGYETWQISLLYFFVSIFVLDSAQTTIDFEMCWSSWPVETFVLRFPVLVWTFKERIVHCRGPSNINCSTIVFMAKFHNQSLN